MDQLIIYTGSDILGRNIGYLRRKNGYTLAELSDLCGTEELELRDIEQDAVREIEAEELRALCRLFGLDMQQMLMELQEKE